VFYDLRFYSGGTGTQDRIALTLHASPEEYANIVRAIAGQTPEEAIRNDAWREDLLWLIQDEEQELPVNEAAAQLLDGEVIMNEALNWLEVNAKP
jgi:hypothetical protein